MEQPAAKRPRTEAQKAAFERARAAREASIIKKHQLLQVAEQNPSEFMNASRSPLGEADTAEPLGEKEEELVEQAPQEQQPPPQQPPPQQQVQEDEEYDYVTFDPDELRSQLHSTLAEVQQLKEAMQGLHGKHAELEQTFSRHNVRQANMLNFV